jgi:hypothetical protein
MAFIGNTNTTQAFTPAVDYFSGNGSTTAFTLSRPVASVAQVQAVVNNVAQNPSDAFTVSGSTITFTSAPSSGTNNIYVYYTSPITQVIAPGQGTVSTTSLTSGFTLPVANGGTGLTTVPHTVQVFTSSSGTYTTPANCKAILIELVGGGGGGGGGSQGALDGGTGGAGGNSTFSTLTSGGGGGGTNGAQGAGGTASGGDLNIVGARGNCGSAGVSGAVQGTGGVGGASYFGGAGGGFYTSAGSAGATNSGSGGGGGGCGATSAPYGGSGGASAGYVRKMINSPAATYSYAVGAGGTAGTAGSSGFAGGAGGSGVIFVTEFYV